MGQAQVVQRRLDRLHQLCDVRRWRQFEEDFVARQTAGAQQAGFLDLAQRQINPRREGGEDHRLARHFAQAPDNARCPFAQADRVADLRVELHQQGLFHERAARAKSGRRRRRFSLQFAIERKRAVEAPDVHEPRRTAVRKNDHRVELDLARLLAADRLEKRFLFLGKPLASGQHQISAEQRPGLHVNCDGQALAKRVERHQRRDPQNNRRGKQQQPPAAGPAVAPGHAPRPGRAQMAQKAARASDLARMPRGVFRSRFFGDVWRWERHRAVWPAAIRRPPARRL